MNSTCKHWLLLATLHIFSSFFVKLHAQIDCSVNAGFGETLCPYMSIDLKGNATGDFDPSTLRWEIAQQPPGSDISIINPDALITETSEVIVSGSYIFTLSGVCNEGMAMQSVSYEIIDITDPNIPSIEDKTCHPCYETIILEADPLAEGEQSIWEVTSPDSINVSGSKIEDHIYELQFGCNAFDCSEMGEVSVSYRIISALGCSEQSQMNFEISVEKPVTAGFIFNPCDSIPCAELIGSCDITGDGSWEIISQPEGSEAIILDPKAEETLICELIEGPYQIRWSATNDCISGERVLDIDILYLDPDTLPLLQATGDLIVCPGEMPDSILLIGNFPGDDYETIWTQGTGPTVNITNPNDTMTYAVGLEDGYNYSFTYTYTEGVDCASTPLSTIRVINIQDAAFEIEPCLSIKNFGISQSTEVGLYCSDPPYRYDTLLVDIKMISYPISFEIGSNVVLWTEQVPSLSDDFIILNNSSFTGEGIINKYELSNVRGNSVFPFMRAYVLSAPVSGYYGFEVSFTTECGTVTRNVEIYYNEYTTEPNAGTDQILDCGQDSTVLAGNLDGGSWLLIEGPANAPNPIQNEFIGDALIISDLEEGKYTFGYTVGRLDNDCSINFSTDTVQVLVSNEAPHYVENPDMSICPTDVYCFDLMFLSNAVYGELILTSGQLIDTELTNNTLCLSNITETGSYLFQIELINACESYTDEFEIFIEDIIQNPALILTPDSCFNIFLNPIDLEAQINGNGYWTFNGIGEATFNPSNDVPITSVSISNFILGEEYFEFIWTLENEDCGVETHDTIVWQNDGIDQPVLEETYFDCFSQFPDTLFIPVESSITAENQSWELIQSSYPVSPELWFTTNGGSFFVFYGPGEYVIRVSFDLMGACNEEAYQSEIWIKLAEGTAPAFAGEDILTCESQVNLQANLMAGDGTWQVLSTDPEDLSIELDDPSDPNSLLRFNEKGSVVLQWVVPSADLSCGPDTEDEVFVDYNFMEIPGLDTSICNQIMDAIFINGECLDQDFGQWIIQADNGNPSIRIISSDSIEITGLDLGLSEFIFEYNEDVQDCFVSEPIRIEIIEDTFSDQLETVFMLCKNESIDSTILSLDPSIELNFNDLILTGIPSGNIDDYVLSIDESDVIITPGLPIGTSTISLQVSDGLCTSQIELVIEILDAPDIIIEGDTTICLGDSLTLWLENLAEGSIVNWFDANGNILSSENPWVIMPEESMTITVELTDDNACQQSSSFNIEVLDPFGDLLILADPNLIKLGDSSYIQVINAPDNLSEIMWTPSESLSESNSLETYAFPSETTSYTLELNDGMCTTNASVIIEVQTACIIEDLYVPNVFSPNNDGINDEFKVYAENVDQYQILIANRWGEIVYKSSNIFECWDGTYKNVDLSPDVFGYILSLDCGETNITKRGNITLLK